MNARIFIDCTSISRKTNMTGIPRVTLEYLRAGYAYGREHNVTVVPVAVTKIGLLDTRHKLPEWCRDCPVHDHDLRLSERASGYRFARLRRIARVITGSFRVLFGEFGGLLARRTKSADLFRRLRDVNLQMRAESRLALRLEPKRGDVLFMPAWWHDVHPSAYHDLLQSGVHVVPLVHDALPILMPEHYATSRWFTDYFIAILSMASRALYVSNTTKRDVESILQDHGANIPEGHVAYNAYDFTTATAKEGRVRKSIRDLISNASFSVLMVGSLEPKKNYEIVLEACKKLWLGGHNIDLIILGREGWKFNELVETISGHAFKDIHLHWVRDGNDDELRYAYGHCDLYLSASLAEGFGLPVIEALAHKLPVLISDISVYREIVGKTAAYFDPASEAALAEELLALMTSPERLERLRLNAINFKWQSWEESGASVFRRLHDLASTKIQSKMSVAIDPHCMSKPRLSAVVQANVNTPL